MIDVGRYIGMKMFGIIRHYVECPTCLSLNHIYSQKPDKVHTCYYCDRPFIEPHSTKEEVIG